MVETRSRRRWPWIVAGVAVVIAVPTAVLGIPILLHQNAGQAHQDPFTVAWPVEATASGDDGRNRVMTVTGDGAAIDTSKLVAGQHLVVTGSGYDGSRGIYVAICVIPPDSATKPGPCVGGVPDQVQTEVA